MFQPGDIIYSYRDAQYHIAKVLRLHDLGGYHLTIYQPLDHIPRKEEVPNLVPMIMHVPITQMDEYDLLCTEPVTMEDLEGYFEYLKQTDFRKYALETGQDLNELLQQANEAYKSGYYLTDEKKYEDALVKYSEAVEIFPLFFEALDNRAFVLMDLGKWKEAIEDFKQSLSVNPDGIAATFSIGECEYKLGNKNEARIWFEKALKLDPDSQIAKDWLARVS